jgi:hypothetical protein
LLFGTQGPLWVTFCRMTVYQHNGSGRPEAVVALLLKTPFLDPSYPQRHHRYCSGEQNGNREGQGR